MSSVSTSYNPTSPIGRRNLIRLGWRLVSVSRRIGREEGEEEKSWPAIGHWPLSCWIREPLVGLIGSSSVGAKFVIENINN